MTGLTKANAMVGEPIVLALANIDSPSVYVDVANLGDITGPSSSYTVTDVSAHGHRARRKIATLLDSGTVAAPCWFIETAGQEASHTDATNGLRAIFERGDLRAWSVRYRDTPGTAKFFNGYITKLSEKSPVAGAHSADFELTIDDIISTGTEGAGPGTATFAPAQT